MTDVPTTETHLKTVSRLLPDRTFVIARVGLEKLDGNPQAHWTATGEVYLARGTWSGEARWRNERDSDLAGMIHGEIATAWPFLLPVIRMHLSDADGTPMHAAANGVYHLRNSDPEAAARLWRCSVDDLPAIEDAEAFVDAQRERWARESADAWKILQGI